MPRVDAGSDEAYFSLCSFRANGTALSKELEDRIEELSAAAGPGGKEEFLHHWERGAYRCSRCRELLYDADAKWSGPCAWPSFRRPITPGALASLPLTKYNKYTCAVHEICCASCGLFIGHAFEDAREKGDSGPECTGWRH